MATRKSFVISKSAVLETGKGSFELTDWVLSEYKIRTWVSEYRHVFREIWLCSVRKERREQ